MSNEVKNIIVHNDDITEQKRDQMNCLYRTCIYVLRAHLEFREGGSWSNLKYLQNQLDVLHQLIIQINKGVDPVHRSSLASEIIKTADMLARSN